MKTRTSPEKFVIAWQSSNSMSEVCKKLKRTATSLHMRASVFRKHGVKLKRFERVYYDWEALKKLAEKTENGKHLSKG